MSLFQITEALLVGIIFIYLLYYVYGMFTDKNYQPRAWKLAVKEKRVSPELSLAEKKYADKVRFFNFWFQIERIKKEGVAGSFAELGVYKGDSANIIHLMDKGRKFHLFDTFEGFQEKDLNVETGKAATYTKHNFADTHIDRVKKRLSSKQFTFHKGYFPDTAKDADSEAFALVSMDADLYQPTKAGLDFFYPRLSPGGLIIIHDYNPDWPGIMKAVDEFSENIDIPIVALADQDNSVMIFKSKT